jgi:hypothetical protein
MVFWQLLLATLVPDGVLMASAGTTVSDSVLAASSGNASSQLSFRSFFWKRRFPAVF